RHTRFSRDWSSDVCSSDLIRHVIRRVEVDVREGWGIHRCCPLSVSCLMNWRMTAPTAAEVEAGPAPERCSWEPPRAGWVWEVVRSEERRVGEEGVERWARG